jgi:hypothetical protein
MKKLAVGLAVALLAFFAMASVASATHSNGEGPDKDFHTGSVKGQVSTPFGVFPSQNHVNAQTDPHGGTQVAVGHWFTRIFNTTNPALPSQVDIGGQVLCLNVTTALGSNDAIWRGRIDESTTPLAPIGYSVLSRNVDNGEGQNDPEDTGNGILQPPQPANPVCPVIPLQQHVITQGNWVAHDGV